MLISRLTEKLPGRTMGFAVMLLITMAMSTFPLFIVAVLASEFEAEFGLSKFQLGLLGAVNTGVGGLFAPYSGKLTDRLGGRRSMGVVLVSSALASVLIALAPSYPTLLAAMALAGVPQGWGNPATNKAIATGIADDMRGLLTGIKQSGVQLAVFVSGVGLPFVANNFGWRTGVWIAAGLSTVALLGLRLITLTDTEIARPAADSRAAKPALPTFVYQVATFGFLMGFVGGGIGRFIPLFAEEQVGLSAQQAGIVYGLAGLVAIPTRISSGIALDRGVSAKRTMVWMAGGATVSCLLFASAPTIVAFLWLAAIVNGLSMGSWNTAANFAMIREMGSVGAGRATGILLFGFLIGLTVGGPVIGWSIDRFDSYNPAWFVSAAACATAALAVSRRIGIRPT